MAKLVFTQCYISINSVVHNSNVSAVTIEMDAADADTTNFGSGGWKEGITGLKSGKVKITFKDDFAAGAVDELIWGLFSAGAAVPFEVRPTQGAVSTSNPKYTGNLVPTKFKFGGDVGKVAELDVEWPTTGAVVRATV